MGLGLIVGGLEGARIDFEQDLITLDFLACDEVEIFGGRGVGMLIEIPGDQVAGDVRAQLHRIDGLGAAGVVGVIGDLLDFGDRDADDRQVFFGFDRFLMLLAAGPKRAANEGRNDNQRDAIANEQIHSGLARLRGIGGDGHGTSDFGNIVWGICAGDGSPIASQGT